MLEIKPLSRCLFVAVLVAGGVLWPSLMSYAEDNNGGYAGLFAPASNTPDNAQSNSSGAAVAPPINSGYEGLISGPATTQQAPQEQRQNTPPPPQMAAVPPSPFDEPTPSVQHVQQPVDASSIIANAPQIEPIKVDFSGLTPNTVNGMPSMEYATEQAIKNSIASVNDIHLSVKERLKNAHQAYQNLSSLADGLRVKLNIPYHIYKGMGLSDDYIRGVRKDNIASLRALNTALQSLRPYQ